MPWHGWQNAEVYHDFVAEHGIYRWLNERLVELADLRGASRVLDLGCGTGATARAALRVLGAGAEVVGIDAADAMVEVARARTLDPRARFVVLPAGRIAELGGPRFDRALSNAAIWQFPSLRDVFRALAAILVRGGSFTFNVPAERVSDEPAPIHPFQVALARAVEQRTGRRFPGTPTRFDVGAANDELERAGFRLELRERFVYRARQDELVELMRIPAMTAPLAPDLTWDERLELVDRAAARVDRSEKVEVPWAFFRAVRT